MNFSIRNGLLTLGMLFGVHMLNGQQPRGTSIKLADVLPAAAARDASQDYTKIIQDAVTKYDTVYFPPYTLLVGKGGIWVRSNQVLYFPKNSLLRMTPNNLYDYALLKFIDVDNVKVYNVNIEGDRYKHLGTGGQWGMGISITGSSNILISGGNIRSCWGDGIYIGESNKKSYSNNITITGVTCDDNRRNGMSIVSGSNITVKNSVFSNSRGHNPMCGLDIEPNNSNNILQNITLDNVVTKSNARFGIVVYLNAMNSASQGASASSALAKEAAGLVAKERVSINIVNHKDFNSDTSMGIYAQKPYKGIGTALIKGSVKVVNPQWKPRNKKMNYDLDAAVSPAVIMNTRRLTGAQ